jgi:hypothetical protein
MKIRTFVLVTRVLLFCRIGQSVQRLERGSRPASPEGAIIHPGSQAMAELTPDLKASK